MAEDRRRAGNGAVALHRLDHVLAAIAPLALLIRTGGIAIAAAIAQYVIALVITYLLALIVDALAPSFGGTKDFIASLKLIAYSATRRLGRRDLPAARRHDRRPDRPPRGDLRLVHVLSGRAGAEKMPAGKGRRLHDRRRAVRHRAGDRARRRADVRHVRRRDDRCGIRNDALTGAEQAGSASAYDVRPCRSDWCRATARRCAPSRTDARAASAAAGAGSARARSARGDRPRA